MENIKEVIKDNLINLRKQNNLTQIELAKKLNYSDKAVSRWENGEVTPDVEVLQNIADIYGVPLTYLFEKEHFEEANVDSSPKQYAMAILAILAIWTAITITFVYLYIAYDYSYWQIFVWGVSISAAFLSFFNKKICDNKIVILVTRSILNWSLFASLYVQFIESNIWLIFLIGIPIQACIVVAYYIESTQDVAKNDQTK